MIINNKEYWEERFSSGDWGKYDGDLQSAFFSQLFTREIPAWFREDLSRNHWSIADYGCAEGGGSAVLAKEFPMCNVTGYDFSETAIDNARKKHTGCRFEVADIYKEVRESDVIFSSNTLEHLREPLAVMRRLIVASRKHAVFVLPFEDDFDFPEHISTFTADVFPDRYGNHYLSLFKIIDCRGENIPYWPGKQILLIYTNEAFRKPSNYSFADFYSSSVRQYVEKVYQQKLDAKALHDELARKCYDVQEQLNNAVHQKKVTEEQLMHQQQELNEVLRQKEAVEERLMHQQQELNDVLRQKEAVEEHLTHQQQELNDVLRQKEAGEERLMHQQQGLNDVLRQKEAVEERLMHQQQELNDVLHQKEAVEERLMHQQQELNDVLRQKEAAEERLTHQQEEMDKALLQKQAEISTLNEVLLQNREQAMNTAYAVNNLINVCNELQCQKVFKLMHFIRRVRNQFFKGNREERRKFRRWIVTRFRKLPDADSRFKPLYEVTKLLFEIQSSLANAGSMHSRNTEALPGAITGTAAKCLEQVYDKPDVIMFSVINYDFRFQRPQHFAKRFAENGHRVFYINANFINPECTKEIEPGLFSVDFMSTECNAIYYSDSWSGFEKWLKEKMDCLIQEYAIRDAIVVLDYPNWIECAEYLRENYGFKMVADYMDDATGFLGTTTDTLKENCLRMLKNCDMIVPSSQFLYDIAKQYNDKQVIIRNGTEVHHFRQALEMEVKRERPVVGYYGAVSHWFAWETVCYLAKNLPECDIVIIGSVTDHKDKLERYSNIKLLGEMDYRKLPEHLAYFDVCLIPFDTSTDLIKATNPVKFYEYLSAGKRIVATEIPELEPFRDRYVYMSNDNKQFLEYVKLCLSGKDTLASKEECIEFAAENDWQHRYEAFAAACEEAVPKVSVIVLTYNNLKLNKYCINSILNQTAYPNYELIVLDNLSTDGTVEYLKELKQENHSRLKIVLNTENSGFAGGNNKAIRMSDGKYVVLLNNDTVVTRGWLTAMVKHLENDSNCGMVGAVTNSIGNESMIAVEYRNLKELAQFAYNYTQIHNNEIYQDVDRLALFCTMIRRNIMDQHGMLDDGYKVGMFEDDDYAMLVKKAGYNLYAVEDCFIHHVNNASFKKLHPEEYQKIFDINRTRYEKKWNTKWTIPKYREGVTYDINVNAMSEPVDSVES